MAETRTRGRLPESTALAPREDRLLRTWELRAARDYAGLAALLAPLDDGELVAEPELAVALAEALVQGGGWDRALSLARRTAGRCGRGGGGRLERRRLSVEGQIVYARGRIADAVRVWGMLLDSAAADGEEHGVGIALANLANIAAVRAEWEDAVSLFARAIAVGQTLGNEPLLGLAHGNVGLVYLELGLPADADHHMRHSRRLLRTTAPYQAAKMETAHALLHLHTGDLPLARWTAERARAQLAEMGIPSAEADAVRVLGMVAAAEGGLDEADAWLRDAAARLDGGVDLVTEAEVHAERAVVAVRRGDCAAADAHEAAAARLFDGFEAPRRTARMRIRLAALRAAAG